MNGRATGKVWIVTGDGGGDWPEEVIYEIAGSETYALAFIADWMRRNPYRPKPSVKGAYEVMDWAVSGVIHDEAFGTDVPSVAEVRGRSGYGWPCSWLSSWRWRVSSWLSWSI